jgi:hypothetical protein
VDVIVPNDIINAGILKPPEPPRDFWCLGTISGSPSAGTVDVTLDGDALATNMPYGCPVGEGHRVLTVLLGRSRMVVANLTYYTLS